MLKKAEDAEYEEYCFTFRISKDAKSAKSCFQKQEARLRALNKPNSGLAGQPAKNTKWGGHNIGKYFLSVDCFKTFCMMARTEKGREVRKYYLQVEKAFNNPEAIVRKALLITRGYARECDKSRHLVYDAAKTVDRFQVKYLYRDKLEKQDANLLLRDAITMRDYIYKFQGMCNNLIVENWDLERHIAVTLQMLEEAAKAQAEGGKVPTIQSKEWLDELEYRRGAEQHWRDAIADLPEIEAKLGWYTDADTALQLQTPKQAAIGDTH
jgi:hypothetical protein